MTTLLPFGTQWMMDGSLRAWANREREAFHLWVDGLDIPADQARVLSEILDMVDEREFVDGRAACVTYEAELARRTGQGESLEAVIADLVASGLLTSHRAADVFKEARPGVVLRVRRPDVVLTVEAAGPLWMADSWVRKHKQGALR